MGWSFQEQPPTSNIVRKDAPPCAQVGTWEASIIRHFEGKHAEYFIGGKVHNEMQTLMICPIANNQRAT